MLVKKKRLLSLRQTNFTIMKKILLGLIVSFTTLSSFAQVDELDSKWMRYMVESERRTVFDNAMDLEASADSVFWVLYNEYETELDKIRSEYIQDLGTYAKQYNTMTGEEADALMKRHYARELSRTMTQRKYHKKMSKQIDPLTSARFVQVDNAVSMILRLSVMDEFPFIGDK